MERGRGGREVALDERGVGDRVDRLVAGFGIRFGELAAEPHRRLGLVAIERQHLRDRRLAFGEAVAAQLHLRERQPQCGVGAGRFR